MPNRTDSFSKIYLPLLVLLCAVYAWHPLGGFHDFWAHAAVGRWAWHEARVLDHTPFLWSTPTGSWIDHSWLSQLFFYGLINSGDGYGPWIVVAFTVLMVALTFALLWRLWTQRAGVTFLLPLVFALAIWCAAPRFYPRPELFTALFLVFLLAYLLAWSEDHIGGRSLSPSPSVIDAVSFGLILLFAIWVNLHDLVAIGLIILVVTAVCDCFQDHFDSRARALVAIALLCIGATFINPFGADYWASLPALRAGGMALSMDGRQSPLQSPVGALELLGAAILVLLTGISWFYNPKRRWSQLAWLVLMSAAFLISRRHQWLLVIVSLAVMAANAQSLDTSSYGKRGDGASASRNCWASR